MLFTVGIILMWSLICHSSET